MLSLFFNLSLSLITALKVFIIVLLEHSVCTSIDFPPPPPPYLKLFITVLLFLLLFLHFLADLPYLHHGMYLHCALLLRNNRGLL